MKPIISAAVIVVLAASALRVQAQDTDLALKLQNPVSGVDRAPFQNDFEYGGGPRGEGVRYQLNFQPVVPLDLTQNWNLITRTIVPFIHQHDLIDAGRQTGLGDVLVTGFFSPKRPSPGGVSWGVGPAFSLPSATKNQLGTEKWSWGPSVVAVKQGGGATCGILANHLWSFAGDTDRDAVSATFLQPFLSYTMPTQTTFSVDTEATRNWMVHRGWTIPVNFLVSQLLMVGGRPMQFGLGYKHYAAGPQNTPDWGVRAVITLLLPQ